MDHLDDETTERIKRSIWAEVATAALRVGCPAAEARRFFLLQVANCKPWRGTRDVDDLRREYRDRLEGLLAWIGAPANHDAVASYLAATGTAPERPAADACPSRACRRTAAPSLRFPQADLQTAPDAKSA